MKKNARPDPWSSGVMHLLPTIAALRMLYAPFRVASNTFHPKLFSCLLVQSSNNQSVVLQSGGRFNLQNLY